MPNPSCTIGPNPNTGRFDNTIIRGAVFLYEASTHSLTSQTWISAVGRRQNCVVQLLPCRRREKLRRSNIVLDCYALQCKKVALNPAPRSCQLDTVRMILSCRTQRLQLIFDFCRLVHEDLTKRCCLFCGCSHSLCSAMVKAFSQYGLVL